MLTRFRTWPRNTISPDSNCSKATAGFQLFEGNAERLGVGNALEAWGYSAFNTSEMGLSNRVPGEFNLNSAHPEPAHLGLFWPYEDVHHGIARTIVFKVQYVPDGTIW